MVIEISHFKNLVRITSNYSSVRMFFVLFSVYFCWKFLSFAYRYYCRKKLEHLSEMIESKRRLAISNISPSSDRNDYLIDNDDYRRGNSKESYYRKTFALHLLETFGNCCAKCGDKENGIDIDHFIFCKNEGGCFIMRHRDGHLVNNAIPLCWTCNRAKSDESFQSYFSSEELLSIFEKNLKMTKRLNDKSVFDVEGKIIKVKKVG